MNVPAYAIRTGTVTDAAACHAVYVDAVRNGTAPLYSAEEARAWAPSEQLEDWLPPRLQAGQTWIAEASGTVVGFLTVTPDGHLDLFFVRPGWRRSGLAAELYERMTAWAGARGIERMSTFASHLARRFLERRGWHVVSGETAIRNGVALKRWEMAWHPAATTP